MAASSPFLLYPSLKLTRVQKNEVSLLDLVHEAYCSLTDQQLVIFLRLRGLSETGSHHELASRLTYFDACTYQRVHETTSVSEGTHALISPKPPIINGVVHEQEHKPSVPSAPLSAPVLTRETSTMSVKTKKALSNLDLPVEILADIMDHVGDWALARAVGVPTSILRPLDWAHAPQIDEALLTGYLPLIRAANPAIHPPTKLGATIAVRFDYIHVLEHFLVHHRSLLPRMYPGTLLLTTASQSGRTRVLNWWKRVREQHPGIFPAPSFAAISEAVDAASRGGSVPALDWWYSSSKLPFEYSELALESASGRGHIAVLDWWASRHRMHGLPLKVGRAMDAASTAGRVRVLEWWLRSGLELKYDRQALHHASNHGKVEVLQWWADSGLQLIFDADALTGATRHNRPEVLEWWDQSGLPVPYRMCDIEEALEDAIGGGERAREWWRKKGVDFNANDKEWMKLQTLN